MYTKRYKEETIKIYTQGYDKQFYLREISKLSKLPLKTTQNLLSELEKENILKSSIHGKNKYFRLNLNNIQTKFYLLKAEIDKTNEFLDKYPVFKTFLKAVKDNPLIIVFGSYAKLKADKSSDLDILTTAKLPLHLIPYKIHKIEISETSVKKAVKNHETLLKEIEKNHVILSGHSLYLDIMWWNYEKT